MKKSSKILLEAEAEIMSEIRNTIYKYQTKGILKFSNGVSDLASEHIQEILRFYSNVLPDEVDKYYEEKKAKSEKVQASKK